MTSKIISQMEKLQICLIKQQLLQKREAVKLTNIQLNETYKLLCFWSPEKTAFTLFENLTKINRVLSFIRAYFNPTQALFRKYN